MKDLTPVLCLEAVPIFESVISIDLLNSLIENTGGDNKEVILKELMK